MRKRPQCATSAGTFLLASIHSTSRAILASNASGFQRHRPGDIGDDDRARVPSRPVVPAGVPPSPGRLPGGTHPRCLQFRFRPRPLSCLLLAPVPRASVSLSDLSEAPTREILLDGARASADVGGVEDALARQRARHAPDRRAVVLGAPEVAPLERELGGSSALVSGRRRTSGGGSGARTIGRGASPAPRRGASGASPQPGSTKSGASTGSRQVLVHLRPPVPDRVPLRRTRRAARRRRRRRRRRARRRGRTAAGRGGRARPTPSRRRRVRALAAGSRTPPPPRARGRHRDTSARAKCRVDRERRR